MLPKVHSGIIIRTGQMFQNMADVIKDINIEARETARTVTRVGINIMRLFFENYIILVDANVKGEYFDMMIDRCALILGDARADFEIFNFNAGDFDGEISIQTIDELGDRLDAVWEDIERRLDDNND